MKKLFLLMLGCAMVAAASARKPKVRLELFPDGTPISTWFSDTSRVDVNSLGKKYALTDYGVKTDSNLVQTEAILSSTSLPARVGVWWWCHRAPSSAGRSFSRKAPI